MILRRFKDSGNNFKGFVSVKWKDDSIFGSGGHAFNFEVKDGNVTFFDGRTRLGNNAILKNYWNEINPQGCLTLANFVKDGVDYEALGEY